MTQAKPTIEDVIHKYFNKDHQEWFKEEIKKCMQEWASLQTPSNECVEFAEWIKENWIGATDGWHRRSDYRDQRTNETLFEEYQIYKQSTPIPIQTPCVALGEWQRCPVCEGSGQILADGFISTVYQTCPTCSGQRIIQKPNL